MYYLNANQRTRNDGGLGTKLLGIVHLECITSLNYFSVQLIINRMGTVYYIYPSSILQHFSFTFILHRNFIP